MNNLGRHTGMQAARAATAAALLLLVLSHTGCNKQKQDTTPNPESRHTQGAEPAGPEAATLPEGARRKVDDTGIRVAIEQRLLTDAVAAHDVDVTVGKGVVTLKGKVENLRAKWRTAKLARAIKGVRSVVNLVEVKPSLRENDDVKTDITQAFEKDPVAKKLEVQVGVEGGVVTLSGKVGSFARKRLAERLAASVRGVAEIKNEIDIVYKEKRTDAAIKTDIRHRLRTDIRIDAGLLEVNVTDGKVRLDGVVGSAAEKTQAYLDSWVPGVNSVSTRDVEVQWRFRNKMRRKQVVLKGDDEIRKAIKKTFTYDPRVQLYELDINVRGGVVTLSGIVDNLKAKRAAEKDALNTVGVVDVKNLLKVRWPEPIDEKALLEDVKLALKRSASLSRYDITPSITNGKVYLEGVVPTAFDKDLAEELIAGVEGVKAIGNNLVVNAPKQRKADWKILSALKERLFWNPRIDSYLIKASVDGGVVTLTGQVDTWRQRVVAETEALEAGAWRVRNHLKIKPEWTEPEEDTRPRPAPGSTTMPPRTTLREKQ